MIEMRPQLCRGARGLLSGAVFCAAGELNLRRDMKFVLRFAGRGVRVAGDISLFDGMGCWLVYSLDKAA